MKFTPCNCLECGEPLMGTVETVPGVALMDQDQDEDGHFEYSGETKIFWEGQTTDVLDDGKWLVQCENGHEWAAEVEDGDGAGCLECQRSFGPNYKGPCEH